MAIRLGQFLSKHILNSFENKDRWILDAYTMKQTVFSECIKRRTPYLTSYAYLCIIWVLYD